MIQKNPPTITSLDRSRLYSHLDELRFHTGPKPKGIGALSRRLKEAQVVEPDQIPADCVTMNSRVRLRYIDSKEEATMRLAFPESAPHEFEEDAISVFAPAGVALIGSRQGEIITWDAPGGEMRAEILEVVYQPEAAGHPN